MIIYIIKKKKNEAREEGRRVLLGWEGKER